LDAAVIATGAYDQTHGKALDGPYGWGIRTMHDDAALASTSAVQ